MLDSERFFAFSPVSVTRRHAYKLYKPRYVNAVRKNVFTERVINVWSSLSHNVDFSSLSKFKCSIKQVDFFQFLICIVQLFSWFVCIHLLVFTMF